MKTFNQTMGETVIAKPEIKLLYSLDDVRRMLSISRAQLYRLIDQGDLDTLRIGRSRRISQSQLEVFVHRLEAAGGIAVIR